MVELYYYQASSCGATLTSCSYRREKRGRDRQIEIRIVHNLKWKVYEKFQLIFKNLKFAISQSFITNYSVISAQF